MGARQIFILRTHRFDDQVKTQLERLAAVKDADVVICADERTEPVNAHGWDKVSLNAESLQQLGLHAHMRAGWQCGDYVFYHVRAAKPNYEFYWVMEPDVYVDFDSHAELFAMFEGARHDFLATRLGRRPPTWGWTASMRPEEGPVFGAGIQLARLSGRAVDVLHQDRVAASAGPSDKRGRGWPNDESFVATTVMRRGMDAADLNAIASRPIYTKETFRTGNPLLLEEREKHRGSRLIYHPVLPHESYLNKLRWRLLRGNPMTDENRATILEYFGPEVLENLATTPVTRPPAARRKSLA